jgi:hypothetical protein
MLQINQLKKAYTLTDKTINNLSFAFSQKTILKKASDRSEAYASKELKLYIQVQVKQFESKHKDIA